jgi:hypothetical protein
MDKIIAEFDCLERLVKETERQIIIELRISLHQLSYLCTVSNLECQPDHVQTNDNKEEDWLILMLTIPNTNVSKQALRTINKIS